MNGRKLFFLIAIGFAVFLPVVIDNTIASQYNYSTESQSGGLQFSTGSENKSIILMIGDGMGHEHLKLAKWVEVGKNGSLGYEEFPYVNNVTTNSASHTITDSAAAATAIATGHKTVNTRLSMLPDLSSVETILEIAQKKGKSSGAVSTVEVYHATPAAFMTHAVSRYDTQEIVRQIVEESGVDVIMGGGGDSFTIDQINQMQSNGYQFIENNTQLLNISSGKVFGLFADSYIPYEIDRDRSLTPSLANMTDKAIQLLSQDQDGFFLIVEGGKIDHSAHANNRINVALEAIEFHYAIEKALTYVKNTENSLLIITADHETGGLTVLSETLNSSLPSQSRNAEENEVLRINRATNITVSWSTTGHTSTNVPFYAFGIENGNIDNFTVIDNSEIFDIMNSFLGSESQEQPNNTLLIIIGLIAIPVVPSVSFVLYKKMKTRRNKAN